MWVIWFLFENYSKMHFLQQENNISLYSTFLKQAIQISKLYFNCSINFTSKIVCFLWIWIFFNFIDCVQSRAICTTSNFVQPKWATSYPFKIFHQYHHNWYNVSFPMISFTTSSTHAAMSCISVSLRLHI